MDTFYVDIPICQKPINIFNPYNPWMIRSSEISINSVLYIQSIDSPLVISHSCGKYYHLSWENPLSLWPVSIVM